MTETICSTCDGTGWKIIERSGLTGAERCECATATRTKAIKEASGIPSNYARVTLDNFIIPDDNSLARTNLGTAQRLVKAFVREFPATERPGLILVGDTGAGKTHLAVAALKALIDKGHEGVFFDFQNLLDRIRSSYNASSGAADREAYRSALDAEVLLLDDLGSHRVTEWVEDIVTSIITHRCNNRKPIIITTNLPDPDLTGDMVDYTEPSGVKVYRKTLSEVIGLRARSRLFEMCKVVRILSVEDYRVRRNRNPN